MIVYEQPTAASEMVILGGTTVAPTLELHTKSDKQQSAHSETASSTAAVSMGDSSVWDDS